MPKLSAATEFTESELPSGSFIAVAIPQGDGKFLIRKVTPDIVGARGPQGATGPAGNVIRSGVGAPDNSVGVNNDYYLDTSTSDLYQKAGAIYAVVLNLKGAQGDQGVKGDTGDTGPAASPGGADTNVQYNNGGVLGGDSTFTFNDGTGEVTAKNYRITTQALTSSTSVAIDFSANGIKTLDLAHDPTFTTSNLAAGRMVAIRITSGAAGRTFTFPGGWTFLGSAAPGSIDAGKTAVLSLTSLTGADTGVVATYIVQP